MPQISLTNRAAQSAPSSACPLALAGGGAGVGCGVAGDADEPALSDRPSLADRGERSALAARGVVFLASWQVMTLAMMLPSSMPMVTMMTYAARKQSRTYTIIGVFVAGYAAVWTAFALVAFTGDTFIHRAVDSWPWLAEHYYLIGAATFTIAGVFQFTPLKERCLTACRSPLTFFLRYYRAGVAPAWRLGLRHGMFCLGCCWALMLVMFGVGIGSLAWMAALAGVMTSRRRFQAGAGSVRWWASQCGAGRALARPSRVAGRQCRGVRQATSSRWGRPHTRMTSGSVVPQWRHQDETQGAIRSHPHT